jgi:TRAP-type C4-dicarboxylate transport system substrate-binding protein
LDLNFEAPAAPTHLMNQTVMFPWAKDVERLTAGRVKIKVPTWDLAPSDQMYDMVRRGFADGGYQSIRDHARHAPLTQVAGLPLIHDTAEASAVALWRTFANHFKDKGEYDGVQLLGFFAGTGSDIISFRDTLTTIEALQRSRIASASAGASVAMAWLGVSVTAVPPARLPESLAGEAFDTLIGVSLGEVVRRNLAPRIRSVTAVPGKVNTPSFALFVNADVWRKLPERDKAIVAGVAGESLARRSRAWDRADDELVRQFPPGKPIVTAPPQFVEQMARAWQPIHDEWVAAAERAGVDGRAALAFYVAQIKSAGPGAKEPPPAAGDKPGRRR